MYNVGVFRSNLSTPRRTSTVYSLFRLHQQLTTDGYIVYWSCSLMTKKKVQRDDNRSFSQFRLSLGNLDKYDSQAPTGWSLGHKSLMWGNVNLVSARKQLQCRLTNLVFDDLDRPKKHFKLEVIVFYCLRALEVSSLQNISTRGEVCLSLGILTKALESGRIDRPLYNFLI